jgi:hypothetical protein
MEVLEMIPSESSPKRIARKTAVALFLPKTWPVRLTVLGGIFFMIGSITVNIPGSSEPSVLIALALWLSAFFIAIKKSQVPRYSAGRLFRVLVVTAGIIVTYEALHEVLRWLTFMAAGGNGTVNYSLYSSSPSPLEGVEASLVYTVIVLLVWIPQVFFRIQLDTSGTGDAQRVLLGVITTVSCVMTGISILLGHFDGGPFRNVNIGTLVVGGIGIIFLVAHPYRSLARACWQRGIADVFYPRAFKQHWVNMAAELEKAIDSATNNSAAERDMTPSSASGPAVGKYDHPGRDA